MADRITWVLKFVGKLERRRSSFSHLSSAGDRYYVAIPDELMPQLRELCKSGSGDGTRFVFWARIKGVTWSTSLERERDRYLVPVDGTCYVALGWPKGLVTIALGVDEESADS